MLFSPKSAIYAAGVELRLTETVFPGAFGGFEKLTAGEAAGKTLYDPELYKVAIDSLDDTVKKPSGAIDNIDKLSVH